MLLFHNTSVAFNKHFLRKSFLPSSYKSKVFHFQKRLFSTGNLVLIFLKFETIMGCLEIQEERNGSPTPEKIENISPLTEYLENPAVTQERI